MTSSIPSLPQSHVRKVNLGWEDALFRDIESAEYRWGGDVGIDDAGIDEIVPSMPSLHDLLMASIGKPSTPPVALWTDHPFGDDAA